MFTPSLFVRYYNIWPTYKKKCMSTAKNQKIVNGLTIELTVQLKVYTVLQTATDNL